MRAYKALSLVKKRELDMSEYTFGERKKETEPIGAGVPDKHGQRSAVSSVSKELLTVLPSKSMKQTGIDFRPRNQYHDRKRDVLRKQDIGGVPIEPVMS